jgi:hypothetical protein
MITVVCVPDNVQLFGNYLASNEGAGLRSTIRQVTYADLFAAGTGDDGTWIFTGLDRLTSLGRDTAKAAAGALAAGGARLLNHPDRVLLRYDLLTRLHADGINRFRPARVDALDGLRYPAFLREANQHSGNLTPMLEDEAALRYHLADLVLKGYRREELIAVEFLDTAVDGLYRKYSAFYVAGRVLARHAQASTHWMIKAAGRDLADRFALEENRYLLDNPHAAQLAPIFATAGIDYGRVDYAVLDGAVQVWEINTAPTIGRSNPSAPPDPARARNRALIAEGRAAFWRSFEAALHGVDQPVTREFDLRLPPALRAAEREEAARFDAVVRRRALIRRIAHLPLVGDVISAMAPTARRLTARWSGGRA